MFCVGYSGLRQKAKQYKQKISPRFQQRVSRQITKTTKSRH